MYRDRISKLQLIKKRVWILHLALFVILNRNCLLVSVDILDDSHVAVEHTQSFVNVPGRNSPWSAVCGYTWGGRDYTVSTGLLWGEPQEGAEVLVWLDPDRPGRAFVDPDSVRLDLMG